MLIHQPRYSMLDRWVKTAADVLEKKALAALLFVAGTGLLTSKYLKAYRRFTAASDRGNVPGQRITDDLISKINYMQEVVPQSGPNAGTDGFGLDTKRQTHYFGYHWRQQARASTGLCAVSAKPDV
jgi:hypothetical protein